MGNKVKTKAFYSLKITFPCVSACPRALADTHLREQDWESSISLEPKDSHSAI